MPVPTYRVSIHGHECTVKAATPDDAVRAAVSTLWDQITPPFDWGVDVTDGKSRWPYQAFACGTVDDRAKRRTIVVGP
ncbi:MAG TPA: hypothetical protein DEP35_21490 [Deltaproteobacteria bacterium]|jgi:hypothetical protein|nr:hypothetical protein [Deltaproteobacteria bacterium]